MELTMQVEPAGWGWLRFVDEQALIALRVSYVSDVLTKLIGAIADVADGAESSQAQLGLEPGEITLRIRRQDDVASMLTLDVVTGRTGPRGRFAFPVETRLLARLGLDLAASVDRDSYLDSWSPQGSWPTQALERLQRLAHED